MKNRKDNSQLNNMVDILQAHAKNNPHSLAFSFLKDGIKPNRSITFFELDIQVKAVATHLSTNNLKGERAILLYHSDIDFIIGFMSCLYSGVIAVPVHTPKSRANHWNKLAAIIEDSKATVLMSTTQILENLGKKIHLCAEANRLKKITTEQYFPELAEKWKYPTHNKDDLAFLQYTSGSTGSPKGVMISHANLMHNQILMQEYFHHDDKTVIVSWLPLFHDMGLIGNVLHSIFLGVHCYLMPPVAFLQRPVCWLEAISQFKATTSFAPNFAYDLCVRSVTDEQKSRLDLSSWSLAVNGAEPINPETIRRFNETFRECGFKETSLSPGYGLAEATLTVSCSSKNLKTRTCFVDMNVKENPNSQDVIITLDKSQQQVSCGSINSHQEIIIVDPVNKTTCDSNAVGEIWLKGESVAQGYWQREKETQETFNAYTKESMAGPFLRTGDLGYINDGELFVTGRIKDLLIIRGQNHYPQDIEYTVGCSHISLSASNGAAFSVDIDGEERLVVVQEVKRTYLRKIDIEGVVSSIQQAIAEQHELQIYALVLIKPATLDKTSSGKTQRRLCRNKYLNGKLSVVTSHCFVESQAVKPAKSDNSSTTLKLLSSLDGVELQNILNAYLVDCIAEIFSINKDSIAINASLEALGGDSLQTIQLQHRLQHEFNINLPVELMFEQLSISTLTDKLIPFFRSRDVQKTVVEMNKHENIPLSFEQQRLWLLEQITQLPGLHNEQIAWNLVGKLDSHVLKNSIKEVVKRHEIMRTTFVEKDNVLKQVIHVHCKVDFEKIDLTNETDANKTISLNDIRKQELEHSFQMDQYPLWKVKLLQLGVNTSCLIITMHHTITDGWSESVLIKELNYFYNETLLQGAEKDKTHLEPLEPLEPLVAQYSNFSIEQRQLPTLSQDSTYWKKKLADLPSLLQLQTDHPRPASLSHSGQSETSILPSQLVEGLKAIATRKDTTLYTVMLTAFKILLSRLSGQADITIGSPAANRSDTRFEPLIGMFLNVLVLRSDLLSAKTFTQLLHQVKETVVEARRHQQLPFEKIVELLNIKRSSSHNPIFQVFFNMQNLPTSHLNLNGIDKSTKLPDLDIHAHFDLTLYVNQLSEGSEIKLVYQTDLFEPERIQEILSQYQYLLEQIVKEPNREFSELSLVTTKSAHLLPDPNEELVNTWPGSVVQLFTQRAKKYPDRLAVVDTYFNWSYENLGQLSDQLALKIIEQGAKQGSVVAIYAHRSAPLVLSILSVLKAGCVFFVIEPTSPTARLIKVLERINPSLMIKVDNKTTINEELKEYLDISACNYLPLHEGLVTTNSIEEYDDLAAKSSLSSVQFKQDDLAYIALTSGSTGQPKAILGQHGSLTHFLPWMVEEFNLDESDRFAMLSGLSHDPLQRDIFTALCIGASIHIPDDAEISETQLAIWLKNHNVTIIHLTPAMNHLLTTNSTREFKLHDLRQAFFVGDKLVKNDVSQLQNLAPNIGITNLYGSTETQRAVSYYRVDESSHEAIGSRAVLPVGKGMPNAQLLLLTKRNRQSGIGEIAEICIRSPYLSLGYLNDKVQTEQRFIVNPFNREASTQRTKDLLYRTGDLGFYMPNGEVFCCGRDDHQVKIRGFRIEPGEVEFHLLSQVIITDAHVCVTNDHLLGKVLVAYIVLDMKACQSSNLLSEENARYSQVIKDIQSQLKQVLPRYMIPHAFVVLPEIPLTANGKIDRAALPETDVTHKATEKYTAPSSKAERIICDLWRETLQLKQVGIHDNFFDLGGHSLLATRVINLIRKKMNVELTIRDFFEQPTVSKLAEVTIKVKPPVLAKIAKQNNEIKRQVGSLQSLSFAQQRLWFISQLEEDSGQYNMSAEIRLDGLFNIDIFKRTLSTIIERHEVLRTSFKDNCGEVLQVIEDQVEVPFLTIDLTSYNSRQKIQELTRLIDIDTKKPFDLEQAPLLRITCVDLFENHRVLLFSMHHIISDGWSIKILIDEINVLYHAYSKGLRNPLSPLKIQYADYSNWQRDLLTGTSLVKQIDYWKARLEDIPFVHSLPLDRPYPDEQSFSGRTFKQQIDKSLLQSISEFCQKSEVSLFMFLQTTFSLLLSQNSNKTDIVMGSPISGRNHHDTEELIGFFINTLILRSQIDVNLTFSEYLESNKQQILDAYANQDVPFDMLVEALKHERSLQYSPITQIRFVLQNNEKSTLDLEGVDAELILADNDIAKFDLILTIDENNNGLVANWTYNNDIFDQSTIENYAASFDTLLQEIIKDIEKPVKNLSLLSQAEMKRQLVHSVGQSIELPLQTLPLQFSKQACITPDAIAIVCDNNLLTYQQLNQQSDQLAHYLIAKGISTDNLVGIYFEPSLEMVVAILGVLKAGAAYVPCDVSSPRKRNESILQDSAAKLLLTSDELAIDLSFDRERLVCLESDEFRLLLNKQSVEQLNYAPLIDISPSDLAYIIYTSGSTGQPKGVMVEHGNLSNFAASFIQQLNDLGLAPKTNWLWQASYAFDASVKGLIQLCSGSKVVLPTKIEMQDASRIISLLQTNNIPVFNGTPLLVERILDQLDTIETSLPHLILSGDRVNPALWKRVIDYCHINSLRAINAYGPTETTVNCCYALIKDSQQVIIGKPINNTSIYVLNDAGNVLPMGAIGELHIGGAGVTRGYLNQPQLTAERFIEDNIAQASLPTTSHSTSNETNPGRLYKSGDLVRYQADGNLIFVGRCDQQVKIRGYRIELGEIEAHLVQLPQIEAASVQIAGEGNEQLVAYVVLGNTFVNKIDLNGDNQANKDTCNEWQQTLIQLMPEYMVPNQFLVLAELPLLTNGKINRRALPSLVSNSVSDGDCQSPESKVEIILHQHWKLLLKVEQISVDDDFFKSGGHSLLAMQLLTAIEKEFGVKLDIRDLFTRLTIRLQAELIDERLDSDELNNDYKNLPSPLDRTSSDSLILLSYAQQRLWFISQLEADNGQYNISGAFRLQGNFNEAVFERVLSTIIERHEILRTNFEEVEGQVLQVINNKPRSFFSKIDLTEMESAHQESELNLLIKENSRKAFNLTKDSLLQVSAVRLAKREHVLLITMHHIISDGWSVKILLDELNVLYRAYSQAKVSPLPELATQYADYACWQRESLQGDVLEKQLNYWKENLHDIPEIHSLPLDRPRPVQQIFVGRTYHQNLSCSTSQQLHHLSESHDVTLFMLLQTAFSVLISGYSHHNDIVMGSPTAGRLHKDTESLIGFFINNLVLRTQIDERTSFKQLLNDNKQTILNGFAHQDIPFEMLVEELRHERSLSYSPVTQIRFVLQNVEKSTLNLPDLQVSQLGQESEVSKYDLILSVTESEQQLIASWTYNNDIFNQSTIENYAASFESLLLGIVNDIYKPVKHLPLLSKAQLKKQLGHCVGQRIKLPLLSLPQQFSEQACKTPNAIAIVCDKSQLTYQQLNHQSNQLAHYLIAKGISTDNLIGIFLEPSLEMVIAILGVLKAGAAYVPCDVSSPKKRIDLILKDSAAKLLLTGGNLAIDLSFDRGRQVCLESDEFGLLLNKQPVEQLNNEPLIDISPVDLAYIIYTSGSTGKPKGVMVEHGNLSNFVLGFIQQLNDLGLPAKTNWLWQASYAFDASVKGLIQLCNGSKVVLPTKIEMQDASRIISLLQTNNIPVFNGTPLLVERILEQLNASQNLLPHLILGGDSINPILWKKVVDYCSENARKAINAYGPTESTVNSCYTLIKDKQQVVIGKPINNTSLYVLNDAGEVLPMGAIGELHIGGAGVTRGYLNQPQLTDERFIEDNITQASLPTTSQSISNQTNSGRLYKSGDLVRYQADGNLIFVGRCDQQVKIRGYRIELGEIEAHLALLPQIVAASVQVVKEPNERLVAYVVLDSAFVNQIGVDSGSQANEVTSKEWQQALIQLMPEYMVPSQFLVLDGLPLLTNGKINCRALPSLVSNYVSDGGCQSPESKIEIILHQHWRSLLNVEQISVDDDFFKSGGHSLLAMQLLTAIEKEFGVKLDIRDLFTRLTIRLQAELIDEELELNLMLKAVDSEKNMTSKHSEILL